jgi:hypothetical protein
MCGCEETRIRSEQVFSMPHVEAPLISQSADNHRLCFCPCSLYVALGIVVVVRHCLVHTVLLRMLRSSVLKD